MWWERYFGIEAEEWEKKGGEDEFCSSQAASHDIDKADAFC